MVSPHEEAWRGKQNSRELQHPRDIQVLAPSSTPHQHQQHSDEHNTRAGIHPVNHDQREHESILWLPLNGHRQPCFPPEHGDLPAQHQLRADAADFAAGADSRNFPDPGGSAVHCQAIPRAG